MDALQQAMASAAVDVEAVLQRILESEDEPERRLLDSMPMLRIRWPLWS